MRPRPRGAEHRPAGARRGRQGADRAAALSRAVQDPEGRPRLCDRDRGLPRRLATAPTSSPGPSGSAACRSRSCPGRAKRSSPALGVISGIHKPDGIVGDLGGGSLELIDVRGHQVRGGVTLPLGSLALQDLVAEIAQARRAHRQDRAAGGAAAQGRPRPHLLCGRRHLARAGAHPHHPERLSAAGDARLFDSGRRGARFRAAAAPARGRRHARRHRGGRRCAPAAAHLCGAGARIHHPRRAGRRPSCSRPSACARACCIRCCRRRSAPRTA